MKILSYLASPYSNPDEQVRIKRFKDVTQAAIKLFNQNVFVFSPIGYNASKVWIQNNVQTNWEAWAEYDKLFITKCDVLLVLMLEGWDKSKGVSAEIEYAKQLGKPIKYITMEEIDSGNVVNIINQLESNVS